MELPIFELKINDKENDDAEVSFIALVDAPAIKRDFIAFKEAVKFEVTSEEQRVIFGPLMVPDQLIYRSSEKFGEHYVKFSAPTISSIAIKFSKKSFHNNVNLMHDPKMQVDKVNMFQSFISNEGMGIKPQGAFSDLPYGTWFGAFKVENEEVWQAIKSGAVKGFSVEGMFDYEEPLSPDEQKLKELAKILNSISKPI